MTLHHDINITLGWEISEDYSKNPYSLRHFIIPSETTVGAQEPQGHRPSGSWCPGGCQVGNYVISQWHGFLLLSHDLLQ